MCDNCKDARDIRAAIMCSALIEMQRQPGVFSRDAVCEAAQAIMDVLDEHACQHNVLYENTTYSLNDGEEPPFAA